MAVSSPLGFQLQEIEDWICCGALAGHAAPRKLSVAITAHALAQAQRQGFTNMLVPCAGCYSQLRKVWWEIRQDALLRESIEQALGHRFEDELRIQHPLDVLDGLRHVPEMYQNVPGLNGMRVVCYYGCLLSRARGDSDSDPSSAEYPENMSRIVRATGVEVIEWTYTTACCGGSLALTQPRVGLKLISDILEQAYQVRADAIIVACPLCHLNLDGHQAEIAESTGRRLDIPVLYFTQLIGLAMGIPRRRLGLDQHFVGTSRFLVNTVVG
jgi:heterodisulfide reductase subunit B